MISLFKKRIDPEVQAQIEHEQELDAAIKRWEARRKPKEVIIKDKAREEYPFTLDEFIGHAEIVSHLKILIDNWRNEEVVPNHIIFMGGAGLGKTTLAEIMADEIGEGYIYREANKLQTPEEIQELFLRAQEGTVIFVEEIHMLQHHEMFYQAMQKYSISNFDGTITKLPKFTLIGATTDPDRLPDPLIQRFSYRFTLEPYSDQEVIEALKEIIKHDNKIESITNRAALLIAKASQKTFRNVRMNFLIKAKNLLIHRGLGSVTESIMLDVFKMDKIDPESGLTKTQLRLLNILSTSKHPIGAKNLAAQLRTTQGILEKDIEPYLLLPETGYIQRTARGRILLENGKNLLRS